MFNIYGVADKDDTLNSRGYPISETVRVSLLRPSSMRCGPSAYSLVFYVSFLHTDYAPDAATTTTTTQLVHSAGVEVVASNLTTPKWNNGFSIISARHGSRDVRLSRHTCACHKRELYFILIFTRYGYRWSSARRGQSRT